MASARILMHDSHASIEGRDGAQNVLLDEVQQIFIVYRENALFEGEEPFFVVLFPQMVWVIPGFEADIQPFLEKVARIAQTRSGIFRATIASLPRTWRRRAFGLFPVFSEVELGAHPTATVPPWKTEGPLDLTSAHELGLSKIAFNRR
jgi:hypothetical protein